MTQESSSKQDEANAAHRSARANSAKMGHMSDEARTDHSGADRYIGRDDPGEAERLAAQRAGGLEELRGALALCALPERPRVLELGCGVGAFTRDLLDALPDAQIVATDLSERLLATARARLGPDAGPAGRVRLERADAAAPPYPARSFDLVACRCVLMHQADPTVVVAEMHRVAAVGGYALAIEPDWGARALYPDAEALAALLQLARRGHPYGFPDLTIGRKLFALLRAAGFAPVWVRVTPFVATADDLPPSVSFPPLPTGEGLGVRSLEPEQRSGPARLLEQGRRILRAASLASDTEIEALIARLDAIARSQDYCSAGVDLATVGRKPAAPLAP
jgi:SAM-dependent methyltransferase